MRYHYPAMEIHLPTSKFRECENKENRSSISICLIVSHKAEGLGAVMPYGLDALLGNRKSDSGGARNRTGPEQDIVRDSNGVAPGLDGPTDGRIKPITLQRGLNTSLLAY